MPANVGVNPSLTITALAEHAMSRVPDKWPGSTDSRGAPPPWPFVRNRSAATQVGPAT
jgi:cholesterol oxidase